MGVKFKNSRTDYVSREERKGEQKSILQIGVLFKPSNVIRGLDPFTIQIDLFF